VPIGCGVGSDEVRLPEEKNVEIDDDFMKKINPINPYVPKYGAHCKTVCVFYTVDNHVILM
jgi:hypothetical protein